MKYLLKNSNGDWSIDNVKRGSVAESRLVESLALHVVGHALVSNTPNYLAESIILKYSTHSLQDFVPEYLSGIQIVGHYHILFIFHG